MYSFHSKIRYSESDSEGNLSLASLLNYFQDCSTFQSEELGVGFRYLKEQHLVWVLSAWQIVVDRYPNLCEEVEIGTFPTDFKGFLGSRNFLMKGQDGEYCARANSLWTLLNTDTMKPAITPQEIVQRYTLEPKLDMDYASRKIAVPEGGVMEEPLIVRRHHLDTNHHVNNGQYINIAMEYLPEGFAADGIRQMRAEYKMQAFLNDELYPYVVMMKDGNVQGIGPGEANRNSAVQGGCGQQADTVIVSLRSGAGKPYVNVEFSV